MWVGRLFRVKCVMYMLQLIKLLLTTESKSRKYVYSCSMSFKVQAGPPTHEIDFARIKIVSGYQGLGVSPEGGLAVGGSTRGTVS